MAFRPAQVVIKPPHSPNSPPTLPLHDFVGPQLALVFADLQGLVCQINQHICSATQLNGADYQVTMYSIETRLVGIEGTSTEPVAKCLQYTLLAFLTTFILSPMPVAVRSKRYPFLSQQLQAAMQSVPSWESYPPFLVLWIGIIASISVFDGGEPWLQEWLKGNAQNNKTWKETRDLLQSILWIPYIHDKEGQECFGKLTVRA
jgi:hypothetical protein